ncbi:VCBS domain-containing protein [Candidatus Pelagibacter sp.]|nr:VCBS domain-containing protein [Candidatus Pelagibacter sp.]
MKKNNKKFFIETLEQRIMLDGAGASTFIDTLEDTAHNKFSLNNESKVNKFVESGNKDSDVKLPFINQTRDQKRNELKQIVFIDTQVEDYQQLIRAFDKNTEIHLIQSNENGFDKINQTLKGYKNIDSLHIIGHGSAGQILFGDALLSNDTFNQYSKTLKSIGNNLSPSGDILFYGCNIASNERGLSLINKISEITKADIAASDDVTGKGGDWKLESKVGNIETKNINQTDYQHDLVMYRTANAATSASEVTVNADGIASIRGAMAAFTGTADRNAFDFKASRDHYANPNGSGPFQDYYLTYDSGTFGTGDKNDSDGVNRFTVVLEQTGITSGNIIARRPDNPGSTKTESQWNGNTYRRYINDADFHHYELKTTRSSPDADEGPLDVYMVALDSHFGSNSDRYDKIAQVVFDREIVGILIGNNETVKSSSSLSNIDIDLHNSNNSTYPNSVHSNRQFEDIQWRSFQNTYSNGQWGYGTNTGGDWFAVGGTDNKTLHIAAKNTGGGDYARILVKGEVNNAPVARNDVGVIVEDGTLTVADGANANVSGIYNATGEHSGDVLTTNSGSHADTDADSDTLVVSAVRVGSSEGSGTAGTLGQALTGTYGQLTLNANGSYSYVANQDAADALDAGDTATDVFNYTVSDGNGGTDIATITITILGANDVPVAQNDVGVIVENGTLTVSDGANANVAGIYDATGEHSGDVINTSSSSHSDSDLDDSASLNITQIKENGGSNSAVSSGSSYNSSGTSVTGTYGTLTIGADGSYTYIANTAAAEALDAGDTANDVFHYTVSDGTATDTATITITVLGANDAPVAQNDVGVIVEDGTLTVANGANANVSGSYNATGEHTGDVIHTSLSGSKDTDIDGDDTVNLVVSAVRVGSSEGSGTAGTLGQALTGTYGQLTLNANGSYSYVANQDAADALDAGDTATDVFNYTVSDGTATDTATITITILGANDAPVAQNDVGVIVEDGTLTVSDGANANVEDSYDATGEHSGDVLQTSSSSHKDNDADGDDPVNLVVSAVSSVGSGTTGTLGQALTGTYGQLTLNANGSYTYVANQDAADALDAGDSATDVFNYTVSDGNGGTDTATITITILGATEAPTSTNPTVYKEEKEEGKKKSKRDIRREKRQERKAEKIAAKKFELPESSDKKFNQGLKLVDLVAESNSEDGLSLKFKVFNDEGKEVQKYYGIMKDGSELPAWITVDSKTGKASTDIPKDIDLLEFKIIAVDTDNNKKQVNVIIDPEKISQDKDIMKQVNKKNSSNITVNNNGLVELNTTNEDGLTIKTATDAVNQNKSFKDIVSSIEANEEFKIQSESRDFNSDFIFKLENILELNFDKIKLVLKNGSEIPSWILFDEATGKITANPPAGIEALDFKIIIEDTDGVVTVKDLEIDFIKNDNNTLLDIEDTEINFVSLNQQLIIESDNLDNYGEKLINNL